MGVRKKRYLTVEEMLELKAKGRTFRAIAAAAGISPTLVSSMLRPHLPPNKRTKKMTEFTGADLPVGVKDALKRYTTDVKMSMSRFVAEAVEEKLKALGVEITTVPAYRGEPLPFEENHERTSCADGDGEAIQPA